MNKFSSINESKIDDYLTNLMDIGCDVIFSFEYKHGSKHFYSDQLHTDSALVIDITYYNKNIKIGDTIYTNFYKKSEFYSELTTSMNRLKNEYPNIIINELAYEGEIFVRILLSK